MLGECHLTPTQLLDGNVVMIVLVLKPSCIGKPRRKSKAQALDHRGCPIYAAHTLQVEIDALKKFCHLQNTA